MRRPWHALPLGTILDTLRTDVRSGLSDKEARRRLQSVGPNVLKAEAKAGPAKIFLSQFQDFMVMVLLAATVVSFLLGERGDAITIVIIVVVNAILGFIQEYRAEQSLDALKDLTAPEATVRRGGRDRRIPASEVVPGDLLVLEAGDHIAADARLVEGVRLTVEEAALTGESAAVSKSADFVASERTPVGDRRASLFAGTTVSTGRGLAVVCETGMQTEMGGIAALVQEKKDESTPLQRRLEGLGKNLVLGCVAITAIVVIAGTLRGEPLYEMFLTGVSLAVAAIPEGLPAIVTIALAIGVQRMMRRKALVRKLPAVETLGSATLVASDKTGTLTQNEMTLKRIVTLEGGYGLSGDGYGREGALVPDGQDQADGPALEAVRLAALCTTARVEWPKKGRVRVFGDPMEGALLVAHEKLVGSTDDLMSLDRLSEEPFDAVARRMSVTYPYGGGVRRVEKGAPEVMLERSRWVMTPGGRKELTDDVASALTEAYQDLADQAYRTLAVAVGLGPTDAEAESDLVFVALLGLVDPPRPEVAPALKRCHRAGIRTVMITGDHPKTAAAVARSIGLVSGSGGVASGDELETLTDEALARRVAQVSVYARVSPQLKLRLVKAFQSGGHIVAMTGDGVNDAPAIKAADIGVAMGRTGTDVTKEASAFIVADDNFATIVAAIEEGRGIYDNIRKFIRYLLACNVGEVLVMFMAAVCAMPLPLIPIQILWVNLVTDGLPAMALGVDPVDTMAMERPPRPPQEGVFARHLGRKILTRGVLIAVSTLGIFLVSLHLGAGLGRARTMAFATLVCSQLFHVFDCRSETRSIFDVGLWSNPYLVGAVASSVGLLLLALYTPALQPVFQTVSLSPVNWLAIIATSGFGSFTIGIRRHLRASIRQRRAPAKEMAAR